MMFTVAPLVCVAIMSTTKTIRRNTRLPFTENSRSTYVSFEKHENMKRIGNAVADLQPALALTSFDLTWLGLAGCS